MKNLMAKRFLAGLICVVALLGCKKPDDNAPSVELLSKNGSYALGMDLATYMKDINIKANMDEFRKGFLDTMNDRKMRFPFDEISDILNAEFGAMGEDEIAFGKDASYAWGVTIGMDIKENGIKPNMSEFFKGLNAVVNNKKTRYDIDTARQIFMEEFLAAQQKVMEKQQAEMAEAEARREAEGVVLRQEEIEFLVENSKKAGITITPSGLQYEVISEGNGAKPGPASTVRVHYEGTLTDGTIFDSSYARNEPAEFALNQVIRGWTEGLQLMREGSVYRLYVPSELGYGERGTWGIPPYAPLIFKVELLSIVK